MVKRYDVNEYGGPGNFMKAEPEGRFCLHADYKALEKRCRIAELKASTSLANNLCSDHRDKQKGRPCLACEIEKRDNVVTKLQAKLALFTTVGVKARQALAIAAGRFPGYGYDVAYEKIDAALQGAEVKP